MPQPANLSGNVEGTMTYVIVTTREFYGPKKERSLYGEGYRAERFETTRDASAKIAELDGGRYSLAHNESARPVYAVRRADSLPAYLEYQL